MKFCQKCKKSFKDDSKHCKDCGTVLKEQNKEEKEFNRKRILWIFGTIMALSFIAWLGSIVQIPYTGMAIYTETVPVERIEEYSSREPYEMNKCKNVTYNYTIEWGEIKRSCIDYGGNNPAKDCISTNQFGKCIEYKKVFKEYECDRHQLVCQLKIKNNESRSGNFSFNAYIINYNDAKTNVQNITFEAKPNEIVYSEWKFNYSSGRNYNCWYDKVEASEITKCAEITKYIITNKEKLIMSEKNVTKEKEVVKYENLWEYLIG